MAIMKGVMEEEFKRLKNMRVNYLNKIRSLPKGCIRIKKVKNHSYLYMVYREGKVVHDQYVKDGILKIDEIKFQVGQRKKLEQELKEIDKDLNFIRKALKINE